MGGGAEAVCAYILEALKEEHDVTLFTLAFSDFQELNYLYNTTLSKSNVHLMSPFPRIVRLMLRFFYGNIYDMRVERQNVLSKFYKRYRSEFDLGISAYNEMDLGKEGIQYLHWVGVVGSQGRKEAKHFTQNLTLTNSHKTASVIKEAWGWDSEVIYPPVVADFPCVPWSEKENGFICVGRLVNEKAPHRAMNIIKAVRARGFDVRLYIVGSGGNMRYKRFLKKMIKENSSWVFLKENISHKELTNLFARQRYGIHIKGEPFGIVVAEMIKAGQIPFVRNRGGQKEIVGEDPGILFENDNNAVEKICSMLSSSKEQQRMLNTLVGRADLFSAERFTGEIRKVVKQYFQKISKAG